MANSIIEMELCKATGTRKAEYTTRQALIMALIQKATTELTEDEYFSLQPDTQDWVYAACEQYRRDKTVPDFPDAVEVTAQAAAPRNQTTKKVEYPNKGTKGGTFALKCIVFHNPALLGEDNHESNRKAIRRILAEQGFEMSEVTLRGWLSDLRNTVRALKVCGMWHPRTSK